MNDNSTNVVVKQDEELTEEQVAKLLNIVSREMQAEIENIHISNKWYVLYQSIFIFLPLLSVYKYP